MAQSDVMCSLLTREAHITRRSRHHTRSAHHVPHAEHIVPKTKKQSNGLLSFFGCGGGIFIALHQIIVVVRRNRRLLLQLLDLAVSAAQKRSTGAFLLAYPLPPTDFVGGGSECSNPKPKRKKKTNPIGLVFFLVAEVGFEPHDLRVMSPTSYQAALPRDMIFF